MCQAAEQHSGCAEGGTQILATIGQPEPLRAGSIGHATVNLNPDRFATLPTGRLDESIGPERRGDPQRVVSPPGTEQHPSERQAVRPGREREAGRAGDATGLVQVEPSGSGER
jgi:hypothetical protein